MRRCRSWRQALDICEIEECTRIVTEVGYPPLAAFDSAGQIREAFSQSNSTYGPSMLIDMEDGRPTEGEHTIGDFAEREVREGLIFCCGA